MRWFWLFHILAIQFVALAAAAGALADDSDSTTLARLYDGVVFALEDVEEDEPGEINLDELDLDALDEETADDSESGLVEEEIDLGEADVVGDVVEVTVAPAPAVAEVITAEEIEQSGAESVGDLLKREAGFTVNETFAGQEVSYQGLPSKFTVVLVDGLRLPGHIMERFDFSQLPLGNIERIEIIRGSQAAAYGSDNAGVIVNLITRQPEGSGGSLRMGLGSYGYNRERLSLHGGNKGQSWLLSMERKLRESYDLNNLFPDTDGDSYRQYDVFAKFATRLGSGRLKLQADWYREDARGQSYSPPDQIRSNEYITRRSQGNITYELPLSGKQQLEFGHNFGTYYHDLQRYYIDFPEQSLVQTGFREELQDSWVKYQQYGDDYLVQGGAERHWDRMESDRIASPEGAETAEIVAGFLTAEWYLDEGWTLSGALRHDDHSIFGGELTPKVSLGYKLSQDERIEAAVGHGYRPPSLKERYYEFASPFGYSVVGNSELMPETTWSYNLDYDLTTRNGYMRLGAFRHEVAGLIVFNEIQESPQVFQTQNIADATITGLQLAAERRWDIESKSEQLPCSWIATAEGWIPAPGETPKEPVLVGLGYDGSWLVDAEDGELGTTLPNSPEWDHRLRAFYEHKGKSLEALVRFTDSRFLDRENQSKAPSFSTLDLTLRSSEDWGEVRLAALNVLDEKDGRFGPEPGRELRAEVSFDF